MSTRNVRNSFVCGRWSSTLKVIRKAEYWTRNFRPFQSSPAVVKKADLVSNCVLLHSEGSKMCTHVLF